MIDYVIAYVVFYVIFLGVNIVFKPIQMIFIFLLFVSLVFFGVYNIEELSLDYKNYYMIFEMVDLISWNDILFRGDPFFLLIVKILQSLLLDNHEIYFFLISFSLLLKFYICDKFVPSNLVPIFLLLLLGRFYFLHDLTQIRASIAIGFGTVALILYFNNNLKLNYKIYFLFLLGCLFHISLLIMLPLFVFVKRIVNVRSFYFFYTVIFCSIVLGAGLSGYLPVLISKITFIDRISLYFSSEGESQNVKYSIFQFYFILKFMVLIYLSKSYNILSVYHKGLIVTYVYAMCLQALFVFSSAMGLRFAAIFGYIDILVFLIPLGLFFYKKYFYLYFVFISVVGVVFFYSSLLTIGMK